MQISKSLKGHQKCIVNSFFLEMAPRKSYGVSQLGNEPLALLAVWKRRSFESLCQEFGLLSHGIFQDDFRCLIGSLVVKLHRNAHFIVVGMMGLTINCLRELGTLKISFVFLINCPRFHFFENLSFAGILTFLAIFKKIDFVCANRSK